MFNKSILFILLFILPLSLIGQQESYYQTSKYYVRAGLANSPRAIRSFNIDGGNRLGDSKFYLLGGINLNPTFYETKQVLIINPSEDLFLNKIFSKRNVINLEPYLGINYIEKLQRNHLLSISLSGNYFNQRSETSFVKNIDLSVNPNPILNEVHRTVF